MEAVFKQTSPLLFAVPLGGMLAVIGIGAATQMDTSRSVPVGLGMGLLGAGWILVAYGLYPRMTIRCSDAGFTVEKASRWRGVKSQFYPWAEVSETYHRERLLRKRDNQPYFAVSCRGQLAFKMGPIKHYSKMIEVFNQMTPHLPYTWEEGAALNLGFAKIRASAFVRQPR